MKLNNNHTALQRLFKLSLSLVVSSSLILPVISVADEKAMALLNRMNQSLHELTYNGTLAYLREGKLSTLLIDHTVNNGVVSERVVRINESGGEISRELTGFSLASIPQIRPEMKSVYSFDIGRVNKIANIPCVIITARPKDRDRYLQKYCIDTSTGMLLDYMLVGKSHKPVEQFMFTSIEIRMPEGTPSTQSCANSSCSEQLNVVDEAGTATAIVDQTVKARQAMKATSVVLSQSTNLANKMLSTELDDGWVMEALPAGYQIRQALTLKNDESESELTKHYVVSDGLSSLSVFVAPLSENMPSGAVEVNSGALNVVSQRKYGHVITIVGEVPKGTLKDIIKNLRKK